MPSRRKRSWSCARRYVVFGPQAALLESGAELVQQFLELERLGDEALGAEPRDLDRLAHRAVTGDHDGDDVRITPERIVEHLTTIDAGQAEVGDQDIERELTQPRDRFLARRGLLDVEAVLDQPIRDHLAEGRLVVYEEQMLRGWLAHQDGGDILTRGARKVPRKARR